jgi:hypothetical protein
MAATFAIASRPDLDRERANRRNSASTAESRSRSAESVIFGVVFRALFLGLRCSAVFRTAIQLSDPPPGEVQMRVGGYAGWG